MLEREEVSKSCDVYSYGILLWAIITHKVPFEDVLYYLVPPKVLEGEVSWFYSLWSSYTTVNAQYCQPYTE